MISFRSYIASQLLLLFLALVPLSQSFAANVSRDLKLSTILASESKVLPDIAEGNEILYYSLTFSNKEDRAVTASVSETLPLGTTYAGGDGFCQCLFCR